MDFYGILFDMKNGKKIPYSKNYFDTMFAAKLEELGVKTITGTLPLTFTTAKADNAVDWEISGNDDNGTENYFSCPIISETKTSGSLNVSYTGDGRYDILVTEGSTEGAVFFDIPPFTFPISKGLGGQGVLYLCNDILYAQSLRILFFYDDTQLDYYTFRSAERVISNYTGALGGKTINKIGFSIASNTPAGTLVCSPMLLDNGDETASFIPYQKGVGEQRVDGYYVPLTVSQQGQTDKNYDIYIGDSPLTEGETVSKTSTGVDLELFEGENTVSTTLYNKPKMTITYK